MRRRLTQLQKIGAVTTGVQDTALLAVMKSVRRFGEVGPVYKVTEVIEELQAGDFVLRIVIPEAGAVLERKLSECGVDPRSQLCVCHCF